MPSYSEWSDDDKWALARDVAGVISSGDGMPEGFVSLASLNNAVGNLANLTSKTFEGTVEAIADGADDDGDGHVNWITGHGDIAEPDAAVEPIPEPDGDADESSELDTADNG